MNLEKAKTILFDYIGTGPEVEPVDFDKACRLGAEALKGIMKIRKTFRPYVEALLPSETED